MKKFVVREAIWIIVLTGFPIGIIFYFIENSWVNGLVGFLLFGSTQYIVWLLVKNNQLLLRYFYVILFTTTLAGCIVGGSLIYSSRIPQRWEKILLPHEKSIDITYATADFYCAELINGEKVCCGKIGNPEESCVEDTFSGQQKELDGSFYKVIDTRYHLIFAPSKPLNTTDIYYVYSGYFEGSVQDIYLLTATGEVWNSHTGLQEFNEYLFTIPLTIFGGFIGFLHAIVQLIRMRRRRKRIPVI